MTSVRVRQGEPATVTAKFEDATGTLIDPSPALVTVEVTADDGTVIIPAGTDATRVSTGVFSFQLNADNTALLDRLTVRWTSSDLGVKTTLVEIAGDLFFTLEQARTALGDSTYDADKIAEARTYAETEMENALGFALVPRYITESFSAARNRPIRLRPYTRAIRAVSVAGTPLSADDLAALTYTSGGFLYGYAWPAGYGNVTVAYEHGLDAGNDLMPGAQRYALAAAVEYLGGGTGSIDPRAERLITDDGTIVYGSTSGGQFRAVGVSEWVAANRLPMVA